MKNNCKYTPLAVLVSLSLALIGQPQAGTITNDLVVHLTFDNNYNDSSGHGLNGTPVGSPTFAAGKVGSHALQYSSVMDGSAFNYVTLGAPPELNFGNGPFSVAFWAKFHNWTDDPAFISNKNWNSGANQGWVLATAGDGHFQWNLGGSDRTRKDYDGPAHTIDDGNWHHITVTIQQDADVITYIDGTEVNKTSIAPGVDTLDTPDGNSTNIGQDGTGSYTDNGSAGISDGMIDDVGIWKRVLNASEVYRIYSAGLTGTNLSNVPDPSTPFVALASPAAGAVNASPSAPISVTIQDGNTQLATNLVQFFFDGVQVTPSIARTGGTNVIEYALPALLGPLSKHNYRIIFSDNGSPATVKTNDYAFTVATYQNVNLPAPIILETFDTTPEGQLPAGWTVLNYTDEATPGPDLDDPNSDSYKDWVVISKQRVESIGAAGKWNANTRLSLPELYVNGKRLDSLVQTNFIYAESDQRSGNQVQYLFSPDFNLTGQSNINVAYYSTYVQNQDNIGAVEYSIDQGVTWLPIVYMLDGPVIVKDTNNNVDAEATFNAPHNDVAIYTDPNSGEQKGGTYGAFIGAVISTNLAPYISARVNDDETESKRVELYRLPAADNQSKVRFRFAQAGTGSWFFGIDNFGLYSITTATPPTVTPPANQTAAVGNSATFTAQATGTAPLHYQWRFNGADLTGQTNAALTLSNVKVADAGNYTVRVTNAGGSVESDAATLTVIVAPSTVTGQWDFDQGNLKATVGNDLEYFDDSVQSATQFGSTTSFGIPDINGSVAQVMAVPELNPMGAYIMRHGIAANGGGNYVNQYTLICDVLFPEASVGKWKAFLQTNPGNSNDGDFFANPAGGIGISGNYSGQTVSNTWYRIAFAVDLAGPGPSPVVAKFINGIKVGEQTLGEGKDGRWSLNTASDATNPFALLFADNDGDNSLMYVNSVQIRSGRLNDAAIAAMGGPSPAGIPHATVIEGSLSISRQGDTVTLTWPGGSGIRLQKATSLKLADWEDVSGTAGNNSATQTITGTSAFYRLAK